MKKLFKIFCLIILFTLSGCLNDEELINDQVYTSVYPIQYLTSTMFGDSKTVMSIYPNGADVSNYSLTDKQKDTYSRGSLFIYNGLTNEKELARDFRSKNKNILFIDATYGLKYNEAIEELWLSPNNYLMLAKNIKKDLLEYTPSKLIKDHIEEKYKELEETLSYMDADLRNIATLAKEEGNNVIVSSSNKLKFLEKYGFDVVVLNASNLNESSVKASFKNKQYKDIYLVSGDEKTTLIKEIEEDYNANIINVDSMYTLTDEKVASNDNYMTIMQLFIDNIRNTTLS